MALSVSLDIWKMIKEDGIPEHNDFSITSIYKEGARNF